MFVTEKDSFDDFLFKSTVIGFSISILVLFFQLTSATILMFSALGASAMILVNDRRYHHANLRIVIESYLLTGIISISIFFLFHYFNSDLFALSVFLVMTLNSLACYICKCIHPPAIGSGLAFLVFERSLTELILLVIAVLFLLTLIRLLMYLKYERLDIRRFYREFTTKNVFRVRRHH